MIQREISKKAIELFKLFPILAITGPRQSGKTTLVKNIFQNMDYVSLEDIDQRSIAVEDPRGFLSNYPNGAIIDEIQRVPDLFSYLQTIVDQTNLPGQFVISGSQNFLLMESISQSLAGRVALLKLLPLSQSELKSAGLLPKLNDKIIYQGNYPAIYSKDIPSELFYPNYINTYIERDVRTLKNIGNLELFHRFLKLCAGRIGQPLNYASLAADTGISLNTAKAWISVLVNSYILFLLPPHYRNFNKRLIKMPKLYFHDTGLVSYLLGIGSYSQIDSHYLLGNLFENYVISDILKQYYAQAKEAPLYFWKDNKQKEIDLLIDKGNHCIPIEIKASKTYNLHAFNNIRYYNKISGNTNKSYVINRVEKSQKISNGEFVSWRALGELFKEL